MASTVYTDFYRVEFHSLWEDPHKRTRHFVYTCYLEGQAEGPQVAPERIRIPASPHVTRWDVIEALREAPFYRDAVRRITHNPPPVAPTTTGAEVTQLHAAAGGGRG